MNALSVVNGEWVGQGAVASPKCWQLHVQGRQATLLQFDEGRPQLVTRFDCRLAETPFTFALGEPCDAFIGFMLGASHLVFAGLDDGHDVIFSRPGLAELFAHEAYGAAGIASATGRFALSRWAAA